MMQNTNRTVEVDKLWLVTGFESNFADHEPAGVEVELGLDEARDVVWNSDDDIASELDQRVSHVVEDDGRLVVVDHPAYAEPQHGSSEHPHVLTEHVVGVEPDRREVSHPLELEENLDEPGVAARPVRAVVSPADPLVTLVSPAVWVQPEVVMSLHAVCELAKSSTEVVVSDASVVSEVVQINLAASSLTLWHVVSQHAICVSVISTFSMTHCVAIIVTIKYYRYYYHRGSAPV